VSLPNQDAPPPKQYAWQAQINVLIRQSLSVGGTAITILGVFALLPEDQAKAAIGYLQAIGNDLQMLFGDVSKLWVIVGPVIIALVAKWGLYAASLKGQLSSIARNPNVDISGQIKVPPPVAAAVPSDKVVPK
jgi:hypothetical protein